MNVRQLFRIGLVLVLAVGGFVLLESRDARSAAQRSETPAMANRNIKHVIRFVPPNAYFPGSVPQGMGRPLEGVNRVVAAFEARYPDTRVEIINIPAAREYLVTQLSGGSAPEIISANLPDVLLDTQKHWYIPLDHFLDAPNPFVAAKGDPRLPGARQWWDMFRYQGITRSQVAPDGGNYCINLVMVETGIFYNKTFFAAHGLQPPATWSEFLGLLAKIKATGKTPLLATIDSLTDWCQDMLFDQLYYEILPGIVLKDKGARGMRLEGHLDSDELAFLHRKGFFTHADPRYVEMWQHIYALRDYLGRDLNTPDLTRDFVSQDGIMLWNGSWMTYRLQADRKLGFDWGVFYLPPLTRQDSAYAAGVPMCVIGGAGCQLEVTNSALADTDPALPFETRIAQSEHLRRTVALLQFITLPENTAQIVNEYPAFIPNIVGVPTLPPLAPFAEILKRRFTIAKWSYSFDLRYNEIMGRMLELYLTGGTDLAGFLRWQDQNIDAATENFVRRKHPDFAALETSWERLAPVREHFQGLPHTPP